MLAVDAAANEHIRIDIVNKLLPKPLRNIDRRRSGTPSSCCRSASSWSVTGIPFFWRSWLINEQSGNAGGLPQWPAKSLLMIAFALLFLQAMSELIKRIAVMRGLIPDPHEGQKSSLEAEAEEIIDAIRSASSSGSGRHAMQHFLIDNMAPIMFGALVLFLLLGYPAAFSLGAVGLMFALIGIDFGLFAPDFLQALPERVYGVMSNDTLLAIPFFTFMGLVLERSGMAEDLLDTIGQLFGTVRGGFAYAVIFVGALLAATTGVVAASVISMGLISLPIMMRYGYDRRVASGVIAASGTLAQIIPPSLVLIVMADQLGRSVGDMYEGAFIPGLVLAGLYAFYIFVITILFPKATPGLPAEAVGFREPSGGRGLISLAILAVVSGVVGRLAEGFFYPEAHGADFVVLCMFFGIIFAFAVAVVNWLTARFIGFRFLSHMAQQTTFVMVPPLFLIFLVLGTIFIGVATPTEGGAMGASGALILGALKRRLVLRPDPASGGIDRKALRLRRVHPARRARVLAHLLWRERAHLGREPAHLASRRTDRLPDLRQRLRLRARLLPRLLRARLHRHPAARASGRTPRHRPDLVRRHPRREHADLVPASAVRICAVLPTLGRAARALPRSRDRPADRRHHHGTDLLGRDAVRGASRSSWCCW